MRINTIYAKSLREGAAERGQRRLSGEQQETTRTFASKLTGHVFRLNYERRNFSGREVENSTTSLCFDCYTLDRHNHTVVQHILCNA